MKTPTMTKNGGTKKVSSKAGSTPKKTAAQKEIHSIGTTFLDPENAPLDPIKFMEQTQPTEEEIASRAYKIWLEQGCPEGCEQEHWQQARQEVASGARVLTA